jgi:hypothetical protein
MKGMHWLLYKGDEMKRHLHGRVVSIRDRLSASTRPSCGHEMLLWVESGECLPLAPHPQADIAPDAPAGEPTGRRVRGAQSLREFAGKLRVLTAVVAFTRHARMRSTRSSAKS